LSVGRRLDAHREGRGEPTRRDAGRGRGRPGGGVADLATGLFLDRAKPSYIGAMLEMANARLYPFWGSLTEALRTGCPQNEAKSGEDFSAALYQDQERLRKFLHAMTGLSMGAAHAIAETFPWDRYHTVKFSQISFVSFPRRDM